MLVAGQRKIYVSVDGDFKFSCVCDCSSSNTHASSEQSGRK